GGPGGRAGRARQRTRPQQHDRLAVQQERRWAEREHSLPAVPVLQRDGVLLAPDHGPAELAGDIFNDQPSVRRYPRQLPLPWPPTYLREHVRAVLPAPHWSPPRRARQPPRPLRRRGQVSAGPRENTALRFREAGVSGRGGGGSWPRTDHAGLPPRRQCGLPRPEGGGIRSVA